MFHRLGLHQIVEVRGKGPLRAILNFILNQLAGSINLLGSVLRDDFTRFAANQRIDDQFLVMRTDKFVKHTDKVVPQLKPCNDLRGHADAVLGNGVVCAGSWIAAASYNR